MPSSFPRRWGALAILGCELVGCTTWKMQNLSPQDAINQRRPYQVRLTRPDSSTLVLFRPQIVGDSLIGEPVDPDYTRQPRQRVALPLSDIQSLALRRPDATRTTLLLVGVGTAVAGVISATNEGPSDIFPQLSQ